MEDRAYLVSRTLELKIAIAENNNQNTMLVTLDVLKEIFALLKEQEHKDKMFHALEEDWKRLKEQEAVSAHWDDDIGHWIDGDRNGIDPHTRTTGEMIDTFCCSWCGFYQYWKTPFCPNCGAKMEGR